MSNQTISQLLATNSLPLLVHDHNSNILLLHKSVRIPYIICQRLDCLREDNSYFLIPLDNTGYYGGVSSDDNSPPAFHSLQDVLSGEVHPKRNTGEIGEHSSYMRVLTCTKLKAQQISDDSSQPVEIDGGTVINIPIIQSCNLLEKQNSRKQSNHVGKKKRKHMICCRAAVLSGTSKHIHIEHSTPGLLYIVSDGKSELKMGNAHTLQDIAHSQELPVTISQIYHKKSPGDEIILPQVFRIMKIVSQKILIAYRLNQKFSPLPEDAVEILYTSFRQYRLSDDHSVNMSKIKHHKHQMSIKVAQPGESIEPQDYHDIMVKSISLPPKLPTRPPPIVSHDETTPNVHYDNNNNRDIKLPQKTRPSITETIMRKFHTLKPRPKQRASLTNIQNETKSSEKISGIRKPKKSKSLRDLPISQPVTVGLFHNNSTPNEPEPTPEDSEKIYTRLESPNAYHISPIVSNQTSSDTQSTEPYIRKRVSHSVSMNSKSSGISSAAEEVLHSFDQMIMDRDRPVYDTVSSKSIEDQLLPDSMAPHPIYTGYLAPRPLSHTSNDTRDNWF